MGKFMEIFHFPFRKALLIFCSASFYVIHASGQGVVKGDGNLSGSRLDGDRRTFSAPEPPDESANSIVFAGGEGLCGLSENLTVFVALRRTNYTFHPAALFIPGIQSQPADKMLDVGKTTHVGASIANNIDYQCFNNKAPKKKPILGLFGCFFCASRHY
jgi:hypothetical protein